MCFMPPGSQPDKAVAEGMAGYRVWKTERDLRKQRPAYSPLQGCFFRPYGQIGAYASRGYGNIPSRVAPQVEIFACPSKRKLGQAFLCPFLSLHDVRFPFTANDKVLFVIQSTEPRSG